MDNLEQRVAELERGMRRWRLVAGVLAAGMAGAYALAAGPLAQVQGVPGRSPIGAQPPRTPVRPVSPATSKPATEPAPETPAVLRAKSVELVNAKGRVVARLEANDWGGRVQFFDGSGKVVAQGGADADGGSGFGAYDDADNPAEDAQISVHRGQADVLAEDKHGRAQLSTGTPPGESGEVPRGERVRTWQVDLAIAGGSPAVGVRLRLPRRRGEIQDSDCSESDLLLARATHPCVLGST